MVICPLAWSISFHLHCSHVKFSSHHIVASPLARSWDPIMLQYVIPYVVVILSSVCDLMCLSSHHFIISVWSCVSIKLLFYHWSMVWCVCQVVVLLLVYGLMCLSSCHSIISVWLSWCHHESSVPCPWHQKVSQKDHQRSLYQKSRLPTTYIIIKSMTKKQVRSDQK